MFVRGWGPLWGPPVWEASDHREPRSALWVSGAILWALSEPQPVLAPAATFIPLLPAQVCLDIILRNVSWFELAYHSSWKMILSWVTTDSFVCIGIFDNYHMVREVRHKEKATRSDTCWTVRIHRNAKGEISWNITKDGTWNFTVHHYIKPIKIHNQSLLHIIIVPFIWKITHWRNPILVSLVSSVGRITFRVFGLRWN